VSLQEAAPLYYNRPLLWLRLAECCIVALEMGLLQNTTTTSREVKVTVVGEGAWRRVVLPGGNLNPTVVNGLKLDESEGDVQIPDKAENWFVPGKPHKLSLSFAIQCLQVAICLFDRCDAKAAEAAIAEAAVAAAEVQDGDESSKGGGGGSTTPTGEGKDSKGLLAVVSAIEEQKTQETAALRLWALTAISYCQLGVGHPLRALRSADELLRQPSCARPYLLLGHVYAAEALCQLGRPQEALDHLSTCLNETTAEPTNAGAEDESQLKWKSGDNSEASGDGEDSAAYTVGALGDAVSVARLTGTSARASLYVNLAAVHAMQGNLQEAQRLAQLALTITPTNPTAMLAAVFVELKLERVEAALALLKQYRHLCVVSSSNGLWQHD
jgi:CCR4-NOT transcription complex subunit 10